MWEEKATFYGSGFFAMLGNGKLSWDQGSKATTIVQGKATFKNVKVENKN